MILVVGDAMTDRYLFGEMTRISPEAPAPIISIYREEEREGAAKNVLNNVLAMGAPARGQFGTGLPIIKTRVLAKGQHFARIDRDKPQKPIEKLDLSELIKIVILVDYGKGSLKNVQSLIQQAKAAGCVVLVDPKGYDYEKYRGADVVKPNLDEMKVMVGGWKDEEDLEEKVREIISRAGIGSILLTKAAEGMSLYLREHGQGWKLAYHKEAVARSVVDVSGAGEAVIAALGVGLHRGLSLVQAMTYANKAAGIAVGRFGTAVVTEEEVFETCGIDRGNQESAPGISNR